MERGQPVGTDNFGELTLPSVSDLNRWAKETMPTALERKFIRSSPITVRIRDAKKKGISLFGPVADFFTEEKEDFVFRSALGAGHSITEHLKWLHGMLQHDSGLFKKAQQDGYDIVLQIHSEVKEFTVQPEALLLPHKLHLPVEIVFRK